MDRHDMQEAVRANLDEGRPLKSQQNTINMNLKMYERDLKRARAEGNVANEIDAIETLIGNMTGSLKELKASV